MDQTPNLSLPYLIAAQAQKHVTHNEALRMLDAIVQLAVLHRDVTDPPASPADGDRYIVPAAATGDWAGRTGQVAAWQDGAWSYFVPRTGWVAWVAGDGSLVAWNGTAWSAVGSSSLNPAALVGVNAVADTTNRLAVKSPAILLDAEASGNQQTKINKSAAANSASVLFQTGYSGRAEIGTTGDDDLHVKVSADGSTWKDGIVINRTTGAVSLPNTTAFDPAGAAAAVAAALKPVATSGSYNDLTDKPTSIASAAGLARPLAQSDTAINLSTSAVDAAGPGFTLTYGGFAIDDAAPAGTDYWDHVAQLGWNLAPGGGRLDASQPALGVQWESKYRQASGQPFGCEWHVKMVDAGGVERRPMSIFMAHSDTATLQNGITWTGNKFVWTKWDGTTILQYDTANGWFYQSGLSYAFNNAPIAKQLNAAGTAYLNYPFFNANDSYQVAGPILVSGGADPSTYAMAAFVGAVGSGYSIMSVSASSAVSGSFFAFNGQGSATGEFASLLQNNNASSGTAHVVDVRRVLGASAGDPFTRYEINGITYWSTGIDNSDDDRWKVSKGYGLGSGDVVVSDGVTFDFKLPAKLMSCAKAALPAAGTVGAGAVAYVTDASGGPTIACSDGTSWRVVAALGATVS